MKKPFRFLPIKNKGIFDMKKPFRFLPIKNKGIFDMKKTSFIVAILGIAFLIFMLNAKPIEVASNEELQEMILNKKVNLKGFVDSERDFDDFKIMKVNDVEVVCNCGNGIFLGKEVEIIGLVEEYEGKKQIRVLEISVLG